VKISRLIFAASLASLAAAVAAAQETEPPHPFRFAFASDLMPGVSENDARAAMRVWARTLVSQGTVQGDPNVVFCHDHASLETAPLNRTVDGVAMREYQVSVFDRAVALTGKYHRLLGKTNPASHLASPCPLTETKESAK
jgi:hypothetical protein